MKTSKFSPISKITEDINDLMFLTYRFNVVHRYSKELDDGKECVPKL